MNNGHLLVAYHGCDVTVRDALVSGQLSQLEPSKNRYDWLGSGAYFFEHDAERAMRFAKASRDNPQSMYTARPIATAAVVGAVLSIHTCLDMTTQAGLTEFSLAYPSMIRSMASGTVPIPSNNAANVDDEDILLRQLDNAIFGWIHKIRGDAGAPAYQAVRGAFRQGKALAPKSGFHEGTHIQIALRDPACVLGWFLPPGEKLLTGRRMEMAKNRLDRASMNRKARRAG